MMTSFAIVAANKSVLSIYKLALLIDFSEKSVFAVFGIMF